MHINYSKSVLNSESMQNYFKACSQGTCVGCILVEVEMAIRGALSAMWLLVV